MQAIPGAAASALLLGVLGWPAAPAMSQDEFVYGRWKGSIGASGLRRAVSSSSQFGELVNRATSYKMAARADDTRKRQQAAGAPLPDIDPRSVTDAWVGQTDSFAPLSLSRERGYLLRSSVRRAKRKEEQRTDATSDRLELGIFRATPGGYVGVTPFVENTRARVGFVEGSRDLDARGLRLDAGRVINQFWTVSARLEQSWSDGEGETHVNTAGGPLSIYQDVSGERLYLNTNATVRGQAAGGSYRWSNGLYYLRNKHDRQVNSLGELVQEPFGPREHLGVVQSSLYLNWRWGDSWSPFLQMSYDYEFRNNMDALIEDPHTVTAQAGLAWLPQRGWRVQLDLQRYQGLRNERARNSATLIFLFDM